MYNFNSLKAFTGGVVYRQVSFSVVFDRNSNRKNYRNLIWLLTLSGGIIYPTIQLSL